MPIEVIESAGNGAYTIMPEPGPDPGTSTTSPETAPSPADGLPADNGASAPPAVPAPGEERLAAAPVPGEADEPDAPAETPITADYVNRRISRLTARHRTAEKALADEQQARAQERAELLGRLDTLTRVMSGAAPAMPDAPPPPSGPPSAEQYASHEDFVYAAAAYATDQRLGQERQRAQQMQFQQDLMSREQMFKEAHPDFDTVVRTGLSGKVSPLLQQALMFVPDGPAVAYTLAQQPDLVQRLNRLPPPLVLVELGRLSTGPSSATPPLDRVPGQAAVGVPTGTGPPTPPVTPLPEPMAPVGGGGSMVQPSYHDGMSQKEFEAWRARTSNIPYLRRS